MAAIFPLTLMVVYLWQPQIFPFIKIDPNIIRENSETNKSGNWVISAFREIVSIPTPFLRPPHEKLTESPFFLTETSQTPLLLATDPPIV